jgi:hypothetical protein
MLESTTRRASQLDEHRAVWACSSACKFVIIIRGRRQEEITNGSALDYIVL